MTQKMSNADNNKDKKYVKHLTGELTSIYEEQSIAYLTVSRSVGQGSKLRTYAKFKKKIGIEKYLLDYGLTFKQKQIISKFRVGDHRLRIETGRHCRPRSPVENNVCTLCSLTDPEDECYFLWKCSKYDHLGLNMILCINALIYWMVLYQLWNQMSRQSG